MIRPIDRVLNEYASYEPNSLVARECSNHIAKMGFYYPAFISELGSDEVSYTAEIDMELLADSIQVEQTDNVIYVYLMLDKLNYFIKPSHNLYNLANSDDVTNGMKFIKIHPKVWKSDNQLILLKVNLNTGAVRKYDSESRKYIDTKVTWTTSNPQEIAELVLTKDYLEDFLSSTLASLSSPVHFQSPEQAVAMNEAVANISMNKELASICKKYGYVLRRAHRVDYGSGDIDNFIELYSDGKYDPEISYDTHKKAFTASTASYGYLESKDFSQFTSAIDKADELLANLNKFNLDKLNVVKR